jgi:hypothetical protein
VDYESAKLFMMASNPTEMIELKRILHVVSNQKSTQDIIFVRRKSCESRVSGGKIQKHHINNRYNRLRETVYHFLVQEIINFTCNRTKEELYKAIKNGQNIHAKGFKVVIPEF